MRCLKRCAKPMIAGVRQQTELRAPRVPLLPPPRPGAGATDSQPALGYGQAVSAAEDPAMFRRRRIPILR